MKYAFIERYRHLWPICVQCRVRRVSVSGFSSAPGTAPEDSFAPALERCGAAGAQRLPQPEGLIFHSDRGSQYASEDFRAVIEKRDILASMSRKGNCWDNAVTEPLFGLLKVERLHGERFENIRQARDAVLGWPLWYNRKRMHSTLDYVSPVEFEHAWNNARIEAAA